DVLVATPKDFGWYGKGEGEGEGRYAPLKNAETHERFRADLRRAIAAMLAGRPDEARASMPAQSADSALRGLPRLDPIDLDGRAVRLADDGCRLAGKGVAGELRATSVR